MIRRKLKEFYNCFLSLNGEPRELAAAMAIGIFIGVTPTIPFHTLMIIFVCLLTKQNLSAAYLGSWINNPLTLPFLYFAEYEIGKFILGMHSVHILSADYSVKAIFELGWEIMYPLQVGGVVLATLFTIPAYFITYHALRSVRERRGKYQNLAS
jgi:uncharacterized protein